MAPKRTSGPETIRWFRRDRTPSPEVSSDGHGGNWGGRRPGVGRGVNGSNVDATAHGGTGLTGRVRRYFAIAGEGIARLEMKQELANLAIGANGSDRRTCCGSRAAALLTACLAAGSLRLLSDTGLVAQGLRVKQRVNGMDDERGVQNRHQCRRVPQPVRSLAHGIYGSSSCLRPDTGKSDLIITTGQGRSQGRGSTWRGTTQPWAGERHPPTPLPGD